MVFDGPQRDATSMAPRGSFMDQRGSFGGSFRVGAQAGEQDFSGITPRSVVVRMKEELRQRVKKGQGEADTDAPNMQRSKSVVYANSRDMMVAMMKQSLGSPLKVWLKHFDRNFNGLCSIAEFRVGMKALKYPTDCLGVWEDLDTDKLDLITLEAIDPQEAKLWSSFRKWSGQSFANPRDMVHQLRSAAGASGTTDAMNEDEFVPGLRKCGWDFGCETLLFKAMDVDNEGILSHWELRWLESDVKRREAKEAAKERFMKESHAKAAAKLANQTALVDFKIFLRRTFGSTFHAWRRALDIDGTMILQKNELFKTCRQLNWKGDVRALWKALDYDNSGCTTLEELDPQCAQLLAQFRDWAIHMFGNKPAAELWKALDLRDRRKLTGNQFIHELRRLGFNTRPKTLTKWLDWQPKRYLTQDDLFGILDKWKPPAWLVAEPNFEAAEELKRLLRNKYSNYLKAWRSVMDKDNSNNCNWHEFIAAAKTLRFHGDIAGAWLALDEDVSGSISLGEIDTGAQDLLMEFKQWAIEEFGSVRSAFQTMDVDNSKELNYKEFRLAMREYSYSGDAGQLFRCLDQSGEGRLSYKEVMFLDAWDIPDLQDMPQASDDADASFDQSTKPTKDNITLLLDYKGEGPGPGAYSVPSCFGAAPMMPTARHGGAFSFAGRGKGHDSWWRSSVVKAHDSVGPTHYDPLPEGLGKESGPSRQSKPAWTFGSTSRECSTISRAPTPREGGRSPGPGAYEAKSGFQGPQFSMGHRWGVTVHPLQRPPNGGVGGTRRRAPAAIQVVDVAW